ncbi:hypothetical protein FEM48_Zijuj09G0119400 [Ziziphus jujuba var. spinosa]|uniref:Alpha/beta hydrolase fold-3 domain-containing protein n=1 Tax=Ziziphus jujuba var. spinosa TaxID=714518 RepID=A0A978USV7_ZIZJJ|nr:hypothetical protein FEM48_Zijuj09G0119400 [Ziziphus jujuba var. spinosa]
MTNEIAHDLSPFLRLYKDGRVERLKGTDIVPPSLDPKTGVESKDVVISAETGLAVRLYIPKTAINTPKKLPLLVYFHGGDYRRAPEHPVPVAYDDSWEALKWVSSHVQGQGSSEWLNSHADLDNVFFSGDSAGANIANNMAIRVGLSEEKIGIKLRGIVLVHPYFWGKELVGEEAHGPEVKAMIDNFWLLACPSSTGGSDDPFINPEKDPNLGRLGCERVLVCIAEKDIFKERGRHYVELVEKSGWGGTVELMEAKGEDHVFHLLNHSCENAIAMLNKIVSFIFFQQKNI